MVPTHYQQPAPIWPAPPPPPPKRSLSTNLRPPRTVGLPTTPTRLRLSVLDGVSIHLLLAPALIFPLFPWPMPSQRGGRKVDKQPLSSGCLIDILTHERLLLQHPRHPIVHLPRYVTTQPRNQCQMQEAVRPGRSQAQLPCHQG